VREGCSQAVGKPKKALLVTEEISSKKTEETYLFLQKKEFIATLTHIGHNKQTLKSLKLIYIN